MTDILNNSFILLFVLPFFGTILLTRLIWRLGRKDSGIALANASVGAGFAWVTALVLGTPAFPPAFNSSAILSATVALLIIGIILDLYLTAETKFGRLIETGAIILSAVGAVAWMQGGIDVWSIPILIGWGLTIFNLQRMGSRATPAGGSTRGYGSNWASLLLVLASVGLGFIAWISDIVVDRDLAFGLAACSLGFYVWNWPRPRLFFGRSILLAGGGSMLMIALRLLEQAPPLAPAIILLGFIFFIDSAMRNLPPRFDTIFKFSPSLTIIVLAAIPLLLTTIATVIAIEIQIN